MVATCILAVGLVPTPVQAHTWGCGQHAVSDTTTEWTHVDPLGTTGVLQPAVLAPVPPITWPQWEPIPADDGPTPRFIWKSFTEAYPDETAAPVAFTKSFSGCSLTPYQGSLWINADDHFVAFLNGVPVASCGSGPVRLPDPLPLLFRCFEDYQRVGVEILPVNELVILVWNRISIPAAPFNPAMVQYRIDY